MQLPLGLTFLDFSILVDVLELQHLEDLHSLDPSVPYALKRFYVVADAARAAEGFSPTWYPHIWRVKLQPLVDSQEYKDILNSISADKDPFTANAAANPLADIMSTYNKYMEISDAVVAQAENELPKSGYETSHLYTVPENQLRSIGDPTGDKANSGNLTADSKNIKSSSNRDVSPSKITGYLTQDGTAPNGYTVSTGIAFPTNPIKDDFFLRLDYVPNRLFRFDGKRWVKVEDALRTSLTPGPQNQTPRSRFVNNTNTWKAADGTQLDERQSLSQALKPKADN